MSLETLSSHKEIFALVHSSIDAFWCTQEAMLIVSLGRREEKS